MCGAAAAPPCSEHRLLAFDAEELAAAAGRAGRGA